MSTEYVIRRSLRTRTLRVRVLPGGEVRITAPLHMSQKFIQDFLTKNRDWINRKVSHLQKFRKPAVSGRREYVLHKEKARAFITERVRYWNQFYSFSYNRISIKNTKTHWGSCSKKGNLNFSYQLIGIPQELADYVVVHELCHLGELNHSKKFWELVAKKIPDFKKKRLALKHYVLQ